MRNKACETGSTDKSPWMWFPTDLFPLNVSRLLLRRPFQSESTEYGRLDDQLRRFKSKNLSPMDPVGLAKKALVSPGRLPIQVTQIFPSKKDGGAFVKFKYPSGLKAEDVETKLNQSLEKNPVKPWFNPLRGVRAGLVKGVPWIEDLLRFPRNRLRVEFIPTRAEGSAFELSQERLYSLFRRYGKITEITTQPIESKVAPRYAYLDFDVTRDAIMARNCLHGFRIREEEGGGKSGTVLSLTYEDHARTNWFWSWVTTHPRIVIPVIAALVAAITVVVFDPIRTFFVKMHIQRTLNLANSGLLRWFKSQTSGRLLQSLGKKHEHKAESLGTIWEHRKDVIAKIQSWLLENAGSVIVIQGPRGSGKKELLLDKALIGKEHVLVLDAKPIADARGESATIKKLAQAVGYKPIFSWANSISSLIDLAVQSTTGVKGGFSENLESQVAKILHTTSLALKQVALSKRSNDEDKDDQVSDDDTWLEAHPERRPVVIIDNFLHAFNRFGQGSTAKMEEITSVLNDKMAEWVTGLVQCNIAHVFVLVEDASGSKKTLGKAMPDGVFKTVMLGDLSPTVAKKFVLSHLDDAYWEQQQQKMEEQEMTKKEDEQQKQEGRDQRGQQQATLEEAEKTKRRESEGPRSWMGLKKANEEGPAVAHRQDSDTLQSMKEKLSTELESCIAVLGGRLPDLNLVGLRVRSGQTPTAAVEETIAQASSDLMKAFLLTRRKEDERRWTVEQAWYLIHRLASAEEGEVRYNEVLVHGRFAGAGVAGVKPEEALEALVGEDLVAFSGSSSAVAHPHPPSFPRASLGRTAITAGRPVSIRPGRPIYQAAFRRLAEDKALAARMEMGALQKQITAATRGIESAENELAVLANVGRTLETNGRVEYLMRSIERAQKGIEEKEARMKGFRAVLENME